MFWQTFAGMLYVTDLTTIAPTLVSVVIVVGCMYVSVGEFLTPA